MREKAAEKAAAPTGTMDAAREMKGEPRGTEHTAPSESTGKVEAAAEAVAEAGKDQTGPAAASNLGL